MVGIFRKGLAVGDGECSGMTTSDAQQTDRRPATHTGLYGYRQGFAVAAADMAARIGLVDRINASVPWDPQQCRVSPGTRILALIIGMMVDSMALYRLEEFYADLDCAVLFGAERQAPDFNDDAIGRALTKLFESQVGHTYRQLCAQAARRLELPATTTVHADTTALTLYGDYPERPFLAGPIPTYGYNKDGHVRHEGAEESCGTNPPALNGEREPTVARGSGDGAL